MADTVSVNPSRNYGTSTATVAGTGSFPQLIPFYWQRKALIDLKKEQFFGQLADTTTMPKHYGKTIKCFHYLPMLDDRNINDQGIDATGASNTAKVTLFVYDASEVTSGKPNSNAKGHQFVGENVSVSSALNIAKRNAVAYLQNRGLLTTSAQAQVDSSGATGAVTAYGLMSSYLTTNGWYLTPDSAATSAAVPNTGNLYGSSKDVGVISGKMPTLSETGGRVNRVGFTRKTIEASIQNFGFFDEYTEDSIQFDNDSELMSHISRETLRGANEITEDKLQMDLLNAANVVMYGGNAISMGSLGDSSGAECTLTYDMLIKLDMILNDNRCPKDTKLISGSRMTDTKVIPAARYAYIGAELKPTLLKLKDYHNNQAFIPIEKYANAGNIAHGEIGAIGNFRFIENPEMMHWEAAGLAPTQEKYLTGFDSAGLEKLNVYPILVVGSGSFTTIGFQTDGSSTKFKVIAKKPGESMADTNDPYGKKGFYSIQWWYGFMSLRPEWIACCKVIAER